MTTEQEPIEEEMGYEKSDEVVLEVVKLKKYYPLAQGFFQNLFSESIYVRAVDEVSFTIKRGEILVLAGESGCGKTTAGKTIIKLLEPTAGKIIFKGDDITFLNRKQMKPYRRRMQIIFQDPYESLNPKMNVYDIVSEPLRLNGICSTKEEEQERVARVMEIVRLSTIADIYERYPHQLSGGQRQRVAVARALVMDPEFVVADEPVSMLDVSIRAELLNLLLEQRDRTGTSYLFITHDLAVAAYIGDRIGIMYLGVLVEIGDVRSVTQNPQHPYTDALLSAVPSSNPLKKSARKVLRGEPPSPINPPPGCRFHPRCPIAKDLCARAVPKLMKVAKDHWVACHFPLGFNE